MTYKEKSPLESLLDFPRAERDSAGIPKSVEDEMLIAPFNDIETTSKIIESYKDVIGGVIVEPFQRLIPPKPGFLQGLREITEHHEIPLIFDEIVTGFRFAYGGAQEYYNVTPDICTLGKAVAGGFPLTAIGGKEEFNELLLDEGVLKGSTKFYVSTSHTNDDIDKTIQMFEQTLNSLK